MKGKKEAQSAQSQRLKKLIETLNISTSQFAREIERKQPYISTVVNGRAGISGAILTSITNRYSYVNTRWLLTGEGKMFLSEPTEEVQQVKEPEPAFNKGLTLSELENTVLTLKREVSQLKKDVELLNDRMIHLDQIALKE